MTSGLRYNFFNALHALHDDDVPFDFGTCGGYCPSTDAFFHPRRLDFDPRVGIAWSLGGTVLRAGAGIYHTDGQEDDQNLPISNTVDRYSFSNSAFPALSYPLTPFLAYAEAGGLGVVSPRDLDRNRKDDYVAAWTVSLQRNLPWRLIGTASYLGNKGTHVLTTTYTNLVNPETGVAPYPAFGPVSWRGDVGNSTFEALQLNLRRAFQNGVLLSANYMWSHSINDDSIGGGESDTPQDSFCRACDKASSDGDARQEETEPLPLRQILRCTAGSMRPRLCPRLPCNHRHSRFLLSGTPRQSGREYSGPGSVYGGLLDSRGGAETESLERRVEANRTPRAGGLLDVSPRLGPFAPAGVRATLRRISEFPCANIAGIPLAASCSFEK